MQITTATVQIPDTKLAKEAHDILRDFSTELLYNHSNRTFSLPPSKVGKGR